MRIRTVAESDLPRIESLFAQSTGASSTEVGAVRLRALLKESVAAPASKRTFHFFLAEEANDSPVSALLVTGPPPPDAPVPGSFVHALAVPSDSSGRRLATTLLSEAKRHLLGSRINSLWIRAQAGQESAFTRAGATVITSAPAKPGDPTPRTQLRLWLPESPPEILTSRLRLRDFRTADLERFAELHAHPEVRKTLPGPENRAESDLLADRLSSALKKNGFGFWVVEKQVPELGTPRFVGMVGLAPVESIPPVSSRIGGPCLEVAWRLHPDSWGLGFATEAAEGVLAWAKTNLGPKELVGFTSVRNVRSQAVMKRIGFDRDVGGDFQHPRLPGEHPLRAHWLYRKKL